MKILMVVSSYGLGHLSRQIALKDALLETNPEITVTMVISEEQDNLMRRAILTNERVSIDHSPITPKVTMDDWLSVDKEATKESYLRFWEWETNVRDDAEWGRILQDVDLIINDIECVHNPIAKKMRVPIINLSNFTWSDILNDLGFEELALNYATWERMADYHLQLPHHTECMGMESPDRIGYLIRTFNQERVEQLRNSTNRPLILIGYSRRDWEIDIMDFVALLIERGYKPIIQERFFDNESYNLESQPVLIRSDDPNTQDYYAAADLVVSKVGFGVVSESLAAGTPLLFWRRLDYLEDEVFAKYLIENNRGEAIPPNITPSDLVELLPSWVEHRSDPIIPSNDQIADLILKLYDTHLT